MKTGAGRGPRVAELPQLGPRTWVVQLFPGPRPRPPPSHRALACGGAVIEPNQPLLQEREGAGTRELHAVCVSNSEPTQTSLVLEDWAACLLLSPQPHQVLRP